MNNVSRNFIFSVLIVLAIAVPPVAMAGQSTAIAGQAAGFSDVADGSPFFIPVSFLQEKGVIGGFDDGTFRPEQKVNRAEAVAILLKEALRGLPDDRQGPLRSAVAEKPFRDVSQKKWFFEAVAEAKRRGFVSGFKDGVYFYPTKSVTLAEALRMLFQSQEIEIPQTDIAYALEKTILTQQPNGASFAPDGTLTRGQFATLLYRFIKNRDEGITFGYASWYGDGLAKTRLEMKGKEFADRHLTMAHLTLPMGTTMRVTNMDNGKSVDVVVNDRGPYVTGRIADLSRSAFAQLASPGAGVIMVQVEVKNY